VGIIARLPLASGILTGKFRPDHRFLPDDHRAFNSNGQSFNAGETFAGGPFERGVGFAEKIRTLVGDDAPFSLQALRWLLPPARWRKRRASFGRGGESGFTPLASSCPEPLYQFQS